MTANFILRDKEKTELLGGIMYDYITTTNITRIRLQQRNGILRSRQFQRASFKRDARPRNMWRQFLDFSILAPRKMMEKTMRELSSCVQQLMDSLHMAPLVEVSLDFSDEAVFGTSAVRCWDGAMATGQGKFSWRYIHNWLVVTGTMKFYDFPIYWSCHHPN